MPWHTTSCQNSTANEAKRFPIKFSRTPTDIVSLNPITSLMIKAKGAKI